MPYFNWTVSIGGTDVDVEVDYTIIDYGSSANYDDPGDAPSIEIDSVCSLVTGRDFTDLLDKTIVFPFQITRHAEYRADPMMAAVLGQPKYFPEQFSVGNRFFYNGTKLVHSSGTALEAIEQAILEHEDFTPDDYVWDRHYDGGF